MYSRTLCWISLTSFKLNTGHSVGNPVIKKVLPLSLGRVLKDPSLTPWAAAANHLANVDLDRPKEGSFLNASYHSFWQEQAFPITTSFSFIAQLFPNVHILSGSKSQKSHFTTVANLSALSPILSFHSEIQFSFPFLHSFFWGGEGGGARWIYLPFLFLPSQLFITVIFFFPATEPLMLS